MCQKAVRAAGIRQLKVMPDRTAPPSLSSYRYLNCNLQLDMIITEGEGDGRGGGSRKREMIRRTPRSFVFMLGILLLPLSLSENAKEFFLKIKRERERG